MNPAFSISVIVAIAGFALKTTVAFGACLALSRLLQSASLRFVAWSGYVYGTAGYWLYLANKLWAPPQQSTRVLTGLLPPASSVGAFQIPGSWAFALGLTLRVIGILYLLALGYLVLDHLRKRRHLKWVLSFTSEPPLEIIEMFQSLARELHAGRSKLFILSGVASPATFGWLRPTILLPPCLEEGRPELEDIMRHELHHVQRWDALWNGLAVASRGLLFFHPGVCYAVGNMQFERELACDLAVICRSPARRAEYAECLMRFARLNVVSEPHGWGIDFAAPANHLSVRVRSILAGSRRSPGWVHGLRIASGLAIAALLVGVAPSLAVLVSFTQPASPNTTLPWVVKPLAQELRATRSARFPALPARGSRHSAVESLSPQVDQPTTVLQSNPRSGLTSAQSPSGPQLVHRGDASAQASKGAASQTIALGETDAKGQAIKSGDSKQAVQQTATAAFGIYRRLSSLDRH